MKLSQFLLPAAVLASLALGANGVKAQEVNPCRSLSRANTVVIIGASTETRVQIIKEVVRQHRLQGEFCQNRSGKTVWMSDQIRSKDAAVQIFTFFQDAGVVRPIKMRRAY